MSQFFPPSRPSAVQFGGEGPQHLCPGGFDGGRGGPFRGASEFQGRAAGIELSILHRDAVSRKLCTIALCDARGIEDPFHTPVSRCSIIMSTCVSLFPHSRTQCKCAVVDLYLPFWRVEDPWILR